MKQGTIENIEIIWSDCMVKLVCKCGEEIVIDADDGRTPCPKCGRTYQVNAFVIGYEDEDNT